MESPRLAWVNMRGSTVSAPVFIAQKFNVNCVTAEDVSSAIRQAHTDVVCFALDQPDMRDLKLITDTKAAFPSIPIWLHLRQRTIDLVIWALRVRVFDVLTEPVSAEEAERCIARLLAIHHARTKQSSRDVIGRPDPPPAATRYHSTHTFHDGMRTVLNYIEKHFTEELTEAQLANLCELSIHRFSKAFRIVQGITFRDYVCDLRFKHAKQLLENPKIAVADVAAMSGFNDPSYFARIFRVRSGMSPSKYRQSAFGAVIDKAVPTAEVIPLRAAAGK